MYTPESGRTDWGRPLSGGMDRAAAETPVAEALLRGARELESLSVDPFSALAVAGWLLYWCPDCGSFEDFLKNNAPYSNVRLLDEMRSGDRRRSPFGGCGECHGYPVKTWLISQPPSPKVRGLTDAFAGTFLPRTAAAYELAAQMVERGKGDRGFPPGFSLGGLVNSLAETDDFAKVLRLPIFWGGMEELQTKVRPLVEAALTRQGRRVQTVEANGVVVSRAY